MIRRIFLAVMTAGLAIGLLVAPNLTPKAEAYQTSSTAVGTINGAYYPVAQGKDYAGYFHPISGGRCVRVQRLSGGGVWTFNYVNGGSNCSSGVWTGWSITDDAKVGDTFGIRLFVTFDPDGTLEGRSVRFCGDSFPTPAGKNQCLSRR